MLRLGDKMQRKTKKQEIIVPPDPFQDEGIRGALQPFWRAEDKASQKWGGIVRLQSLVSPELSARYGQAYTKLRQAIQSLDADETAKRASVCIRGLEALDKAASETQEPLEPRSIFIQHHGRSYIVAVDRVDLPAICAPEGVPVLSLQELLEARQMVLESQISALDAIQAAYQGAEITYKSHDDPLPF